MHPRAFWAAIAAALPLAAQAAGPQLSIQQVQMDKRTWPSSMRARAWVNVVGSSGSPIQGVGPDVFRVDESGSSSSSKITRVETLESHGTGASIVLVIQASGAMEPVCEELKKSASAFVNGLQERDQVAAVDYAETAETIAPFSPEKGEVAGKIGKMTCTGKSFLLYDGLAQAISLFSATPGKGQKVEIAMESDSGSGLKDSLMVRTPDYFDWIRLGAWVVGILLLVIVGAAIYVLTRPKPPPQRFCFVCKRAQMPEWDVCLFCLKSAKARLLVQKGMNKGKTYPLVGKVVSLGSGPENNIRILDGAVSGKHAGVSIDDNKFEIVDLGSKNGVLVNGKRTPRRFLRNGDVITLGMTELKFESTVAAGGDEEADD